MKVLRHALWIVAVLAVVAAGALYSFQSRDDSAPPRAQAAAAPPAPPAPRQTTARAATAQSAPASTSAVATTGAAPATDPFEIIRALAQRAYDGDGAAQYRIARELDRCEKILSMIRNERDPEAAIWGWGTQWTPAMKEFSIAEYRRCKRLAAEDPFASLPRRDGGYGYHYWMQRAFDAGHPLAVTTQTIRNLNLLRAQVPTEQPVDRPAAIDALANAALSDEPNALLQMGISLWQLEDAPRHARGAALMLAACRAGADCGSDSDVFPFALCYHSGHQECGPGASIENLLSRTARPEQFARAYADSQQIEEALRNRDAEAFKAWLDLL